MEIKIEKEGTKGAFVAIVDGKTAGKITYSVAGEHKYILDHTEVDDAFRGQSIGKKIVHYIVDYARKNNIKILPLCPFAKSVFDKDESIKDVL